MKVFLAMTLVALAVTIGIKEPVKDRVRLVSEVTSSDHPYLLFSDSDADSGGAMHTRWFRYQS